jgi:hypothetical protein
MEKQQKALKLATNSRYEVQGLSKQEKIRCSTFTNCTKGKVYKIAATK